jgi:cyclopropane-fatty-acyl-phospholipid synthase
MHVLDIGSGWGGMALYLAKHCDCRVTGVTLSEEQFKLSKQRIEEAGLEDRITIELRDYRTLDGRFDRIVSIGMLEHVGQFHLGEYFNKVRDLLEADGVALIHTITRMDKPRPISAWLHKYIFPGAYLPTASQMMRSIENSHLWLTDLENLRLHYAYTLQRWHQRFAENRDKVAKLYDERFCRMWELYLQASEATFKYQDITVFQMQITRDINALPITRDYLYHAEQALAEKDS